MSKSNSFQDALQEEFSRYSDDATEQRNNQDWISSIDDGPSRESNSNSFQDVLNATTGKLQNARYNDPVYRMTHNGNFGDKLTAMQNGETPRESQADRLPKAAQDLKDALGFSY